MSTKRFLIGLAALFLLAAPAFGATVEDRSPFRQGHWWNPARSGHGFEILSSGEQVFLVWYTYDDGGRPTWYTAQGPQQSMGGAWPLQKHRWSGGRIVDSTNVGIVRLTVNHFESMTASWQVGSGQGTWSIEPFVASGTINEVDLTGHWYDPAHSGWGMTLLDQGDVFGAVIYAYDAAGAPTWVAGFDRGKGTHVELRWTRGSCPSCEYRIVGSESAGAIDIAWRGDTEVTVRGSPSVPLAPDLRIDGASVRQLGRPASTRTVDYQLASFAREQTLRSFLAAGMEHRVMGAVTDFSAAPPPSATTFSTTNLQESGVDEADVVKSDGRYVYALTPLANSSANARKVRIAYVGDGGFTLEPRAEIEPYAPANASFGGLYLHGATLATLASAGSWGGWYYAPSPVSQTAIEFLDVSNPAAPASRWRAMLSGALVSSRRIGERMYVVTRFTPNPPGYVLYASTDEARAANRAAMDGAPLSALLPSISVNGGAPVPAVAPSNVYTPQLAGANAVAEMTVVSVFDIAAPRLVQSLAIAGHADTLYASPSNLYLASSRYDVRDTIGIVPPPQPALYSTDIHQIRIDADGVRVVASGSIEGNVGTDEMAPFRFGEDQGRLRVVSSTGTGMWGQGNANRLTILEPSSVAPGLLKTVSFLPNGRRPQTLGKPNEFLYSTRFVGDRLYAVTFKKVDPLYVVDLSDRSDPKITGALEIPGFSDYLHPMANGLLLGFGKDAKPSDTSSGDGGQFAWYQGLQLTLFDVSDPGAPRQLQRILVGKRGSDSALLYTHHAFSALARADGTTAVAIPARIHDGPTGPEDWAMAPWQYSGLLRFEVRGTTPADASIVQLQALVSDRAASTNQNPSSYDYEHASRSVLFPDASVLCSNGQFWRMDNGGMTFGPY